MRPDPNVAALLAMHERQRAALEEERSALEAERRSAGADRKAEIADREAKIGAALRALVSTNDEAARRVAEDRDAAAALRARLATPSTGAEAAMVAIGAHDRAKRAIELARHLPSKLADRARIVGNALDAIADALDAIPDLPSGWTSTDQIKSFETFVTRVTVRVAGNEDTIEKDFRTHLERGILTIAERCGPTPTDRTVKAAAEMVAMNAGIASPDFGRRVRRHIDKLETAIRTAARREPRGGQLRRGPRWRGNRPDLRKAFEEAIKGLFDALRLGPVKPSTRASSRARSTRGKKPRP